MSTEIYPRSILFVDGNNDEKELEIYQEVLTDVGGVIWDSALLTIHYFFKNPDSWKNKKVLELGSGTGVCGLVLAALGANVTVTDLPDRMDLLHKNIRRNEAVINGSVHAEVLDWTKHKAPRDLDLIVAVDCVYYNSSIDPLINFFTESSSKEILVVSEKRDIGEACVAQNDFFKKIKESFDLFDIPREQLDEDYYADDIIIVKLVKK